MRPVHTIVNPGQKRGEKPALDVYEGAPQRMQTERKRARVTKVRALERPIYAGKTAKLERNSRH